MKPAAVKQRINSVYHLGSMCNARIIKHAAGTIELLKQKILIVSRPATGAAFIINLLTNMDTNTDRR